MSDYRFPDQYSTQREDWKVTSTSTPTQSDKAPAYIASRSLHWATFCRPAFQWREQPSGTHCLPAQSPLHACRSSASITGRSCAAITTSSTRCGRKFPRGVASIFIVRHSTPLSSSHLSIRIRPRSTPASPLRSVCVTLSVLVPHINASPYRLDLHIRHRPWEQDCRSTHSIEAAGAAHCCRWGTP